MKERKWKVYIHENKVNGKRYVGITSKKNVNDRWIGGKGYKNNKHFTSSIEKYGWEDGFYHYIIEENPTREEACNTEKEFIKLWDLNNPRNGYNKTYGGEGTHGHIVSEENRRIASITHKGKTISEEHRRAISEKLSGENNPFFGQKHTDETRKFISEMRKASGVSAGGNNPRAKKVICDNTVYDCAGDCADHYGIKSSTLRSWLNGRRPMPESFKLLGLMFYER